MNCKYKKVNMGGFYYCDHPDVRDMSKWLRDCPMEDCRKETKQE